MRHFLKEVSAGVRSAGIPRSAASLSFYALYALAPMIVIFISLSGLIIDRGVIESELLNFFQVRAGDRVAMFLAEILDGVKRSGSHLLFSFVGFFIMIYGLSHFFNALKKSFFQIFGVHFMSGRTLEKTFFNYLKSLSFSFFLGLLLFILFFAVIVAPIVLNFSANILNIDLLTKIPLLNFLIILSIVLIGLSVMYKTISINLLSWKSAFVGAACGALLFTMLNFVLSLYFKLFESPHAVYGASGSLIAFLLWVYYSSQILLIGALTSAIADKSSLKKIISKTK